MHPMVWRMPSVMRLLGALGSLSETEIRSTFNGGLGMVCVVPAAVVAITVFFMLIAHLRWWANLTLAVLAVPISIAVNGLRVAMIGMVGNTWGQDAGQRFHDTSGYIGLVICFAILYGLTKKLGWK